MTKRHDPGKDGVIWTIEDSTTDDHAPPPVPGRYKVRVGELSESAEDHDVHDVVSTSRTTAALAAVNHLQGPNRVSPSLQGSNKVLERQYRPLATDSHGLEFVIDEDDLSQVADVSRDGHGATSIDFARQIGRELSRPARVESTGPRPMGKCGVNSKRQQDRAWARAMCRKIYAG